MLFRSFTNDGADYFNGTYDEFLEKIGWDEDEIVEKKKVEKNIIELQDKLKWLKNIKIDIESILEI